MKLLKNLNEAVKKLTLMDKFKEMYPVVKDLQSIRKKGSILEDLMEELMDKYKMKSVKKESSTSDFLPSVSAIYTSSDKRVGMYWFATHGAGIPTLLVGTKDKDMWSEVRQHLRAKGGIREGLEENMQMINLINLPELIQRISKTLKKTPTRSYKHSLGRKYRWEVGGAAERLGSQIEKQFVKDVKKIIIVPHNEDDRVLGSISVVVQ